jgi:hypothetical protein
MIGSLEAPRSVPVPFLYGDNGPFFWSDHGFEIVPVIFNPSSACSLAFAFLFASY